MRGTSCGSETASINDFAVLVESAVMAPNITKVDTYRQLGLGMPACNFRDEVLRRLLHGIQSAPLKRLAHSI